MSAGRLLVSFWSVCLENLPEGSFRRRRMAAAEVRTAVAQARDARALLCVSDTDLMAPYHARERDKHAQLCRALADHCGIAISIEEFCSKSEAEGGGLYSINPLNCVRVQGSDRLMIITCAYTFADAEETDDDLRFEIAPDSIEFHLVEAIG